MVGGISYPRLESCVYPTAARSDGPWGVRARDRRWVVSSRSAAGLILDVSSDEKKEKKTSIEEAGLDLQSSFFVVGFGLEAGGVQCICE